VTCILNKFGFNGSTQSIKLSTVPKNQEKRFFQLFTQRKTDKSMACEVSGVSGFSKASACFYLLLQYLAGMATVHKHSVISLGAVCP
jgi:hypothetical protein